jgi:hypothetical protein
MNASDSQALVSLYQLSLALRLPRNWLHAEALAGRIPCLRVGRRLRFNRNAVEAALAARAGETTAGQQEAAHA